LARSKRNIHTNGILRRKEKGMPQPLTKEHLQISLPTLPVLCVGSGRFSLLSADGELAVFSSAQDAKKALKPSESFLVCHAPYTRGRLGLENLHCLDVMELYAFTHPARFCVPTPLGLAKTLGQDIPASIEDMPLSLIQSARILLDDISRHPKKEDMIAIAQVMGLHGKGWGWTPFVIAALGDLYDPSTQLASRSMLGVWKNLPEWGEDPPLPPPAQYPVTKEEVTTRLQEILLLAANAEKRAPQMEYAGALAAAFSPPRAADEPHVILAEAGTGVGKTLGYLTPASLWAEKNEGSVWVSTYTKNLQRQIESEIAKIYPDPDLREAKVAVRKGRENYLCLLNFEDLAAAAGLAAQPVQAVAAGLMARWIMDAKSGDLSGPEFPGWLPGILGSALTLGLADRRGECVFSACDHYRRCFSERAIRKAKRSSLVIANHAVLMIKAAHRDDDLPRRIILDEGHHLFDAADSSFCAEMTGIEMQDLRRWIIGPEGGRKSRARGLKKRIEDLLEGDREGTELLEDVIHHARFLPSADWLKRLKQNNAQGAAEDFFAKVFVQVFARADGRHGPYSLETPTFPADEALLASARKLRGDLVSLRTPMTKLAKLLHQKLTDGADTLSPDYRRRLDASAQTLERRVRMELSAWIAMLESLEQGASPAGVVDWMEIQRGEGHIFDVGLMRHYIDPSVPFAESLKPHAHSVIVTSATLRDVARADNAEAGWDSAKMMSGASALTPTPTTFAIPSPYDYAGRTRVFIATDVRKDDLDQLASAYRSLFEASGGGGLGLFTSIQRLRAVHRKIEEPLAQSGLTLYAQHVDGIDPGTLVDMFRDDVHSCLLGTDAIRDGVDVPGEALRLIAFDRVPWPRATLLHKARRAAFGKSSYEDRLTRLKLKQAYGRLIRRSEDRGVFVMLDGACPSRLMDAFPEGVEIRRAGLAEIIEETRGFLK
jgi:ATP-dependent DNA helicase DinG